MDEIKQHIRDVVDFPKAGITFKDITPLLTNHDVLQDTIDGLERPYRKEAVTAVAGIEARGFIFRSLVAQSLKCAFIPIRKPGKLPCATYEADYELEYGKNMLQIHQDALHQNDRVLIVDDLLATGGTAAASVKLVEKTGASVAGVAFVVELDFLNGREKLNKYTIHSLVHY